MLAKVKKVIAYMEELAPSSIAMSGDPVGLQLGNPEAEVQNILVTLDPDLEALREAEQVGAEMLVTHHPLFYNKINSINENYPAGFLVASALRKGLSIFSAHTNYDVAPYGINYHLAKSLDLPASSGSIVEVTGSEQLLKLVVFIPAGYEENVINAISRAGAGKIGDYSQCTFQISGTGTFMPGEGTEPYIGSQGQLAKVDEVRVETILPATRKKEVIQTLIQAHPYEEVAYDLYPLALEGKTIGLGLFFELKDQVSLETIIKKCHEELKPDALRFFDAGKDKFSRIAICGGSGGSLIEKVVQQQAEIFISGDFRYHDLKLAQDYGLALVDAGHDATEWPGVVFIKKYLEKRLEKENYDTGVYIKTSASKGWQ